MRSSLFLGFSFAVLICLIVITSLMRSGDTAYAQTHEARLENAFLAEWDRYAVIPDPSADDVEKIFWMECETNRFDAARELMTKLQAKHQKNADAQYDEVYSSAYSKMANADIYQHKFADALKKYESQLAYDRKHLPGDDKRIGRDYNNIGMLYFIMGHTTDNTSERERLWKSAAESYHVAGQTKIAEDPTLNLSLQQNKLSLAQGRKDLPAVAQLQESTIALRKQLDVKVPLMPF
jgi:hypothetical protein